MLALRQLDPNAQQGLVNQLFLLKKLQFVIFYETLPIIFIQTFVLQYFLILGRLMSALGIHRVPYDK